ncbi:16S rRNA (guanine(527)-N(7))-methyltransferase RsmG [Roseitranquillus sediminis]|uniref:16S rRNA (guanine(527)-N(7))-methyltransferase RsmG n=1 Tax=Roseitranquillus sediminis TaxID=2809051 RepID=UPI001D0CA290|nr:16S rRNA (guanine(527)-N(7))-methyltransferase RsmG [Roseitranquillus sediminis]MBM9596224.1 16S rRNA (guanine(527)-N(7))-methyltransferase RsmG [Roseitranquillus sediminis]
MRPDELGVSRETSERLDLYVRHLLKWNAAINLVGRPITSSQVWTRHVADCVQLAPWLPQASRWTDLGSGGGLPGIVVAILAKEHGLPREVTCIESDGRKAEFLRSVQRAIDLPIQIICNRIEAAPPQGADIVSARALAPLPRLLGLVSRHLAQNGTALLMKGAGWREEVEVARKEWHLLIEAVPSRTNTDAVILEIGELRRR